MRAVPRQPSDNALGEQQSKALLQHYLEDIKPALVIGATQAQADASAQFVTSAYLPHHGRPGLMPTPPRSVVQTVAYEGNPAYLGRWHGRLVTACHARGWQFVINPSTLSDADLLVAFRDGPWDGWMCREWKSGVKLVNALAAGRPMLTQASAAVREIPAAPSVIVTQEFGLDDALDLMAPLATRQRIADGCVAPAAAYRVDAIAARLQHILSDVLACTPAA